MDYTNLGGLEKKHGLQSLREWLVQEEDRKDADYVTYAVILATARKEDDEYVVKPFTVAFIPDEVPLETINPEIQDGIAAIVEYAYCTTIPEEKRSYPYCAGNFVFYDEVDRIDTSDVQDALVASCGARYRWDVSVTRDPVPYENVDMRVLDGIVRDDMNETEARFKWRAMTIKGKELTEVTGDVGFDTLAAHLRGEREGQAGAPILPQYIMATMHVPWLDQGEDTTKFWFVIIPDSNYLYLVPNWHNDEYAKCITGRAVETMYAAGHDANELYTHWPVYYRVQEGMELERFKEMLKETFLYGANPMAEERLVELMEGLQL